MDLTNLKDKNAIEQLIKMYEYKKVVVENLDRLRNMQGTVEQKTRVISKCGTIKFETEYGASMHSHAHNDSELNELLVNTAVTYYTERLQSLSLLLGLAERVVAKEFEGGIE